MKGRTTFVIAHRLSTIRRADQILVVEGGRIVERGTHESLYARRGRYYELYTRQHGLEANLFLAPGERREPGARGGDRRTPRLHPRPRLLPYRITQNPGCAHEVVGTACSWCVVACALAHASA